MVLDKLGNSLKNTLSKIAKSMFVDEKLINELIKDIQSRLNVTCIVISHDIPGTFKIAHQIAMLLDGKIIEYGTPEEIKKSSNPAVIQFIEGKREGPIQVL